MKNEDRFPGLRTACRRPLAFQLTFGFCHSFDLRHSCFVIVAILVATANPAWGAAPHATDAIRQLADTWRREHRFIDLHQHIDDTPEHLARAVRIMDRVGIGVEVNLSGGTTTHEPGKTSEFERNKALADRLYPGRFVHYMNLDYGAWDQPDFPEQAARQIDEGHRLGAAGFKEFKRLRSEERRVGKESRSRWAPEH